MANPPYLLFDTDALLQIYISRQVQILQELKRSYGVQPAVLPEVEEEVCWTKRFKDRFERDLRKTVTSGTLTIFEQPELQQHLLGGSGSPAAALAATKDLFQQGEKYNLYADTGEAYTHAIGSALRIPVVSNDFTAITALRDAGLSLPSPVLRFYDLIVFGYQVEILSERAVDKI